MVRGGGGKTGENWQAAARGFCSVLFVNTEYPAWMEQLQDASYFSSENSGISKINALHLYYNSGIAFTEANEA